MNRFRPLLLLAGLLVTACWFNFYDAEAPETRDWPAAGIDTIYLNVDNGAIGVTARADTTITTIITKRCKGTNDADAEAHLGDIVISESLAGSALFLRATAPTPNTRSYAADFAISAPDSTVLRITSANGAVTLTGMAEYASIVAANGAVTTTAHTGHLDVAAANGAVNCDMADMGMYSSVALHSNNGAVELAIPTDAEVVFDASTNNGSVQVNGFTLISYTVNEPKHKSGEINSGWGSATLSSNNGRVTLRAR